MMRLVIAAVGSLKERHFADAADEYLRRLRPYAKVLVTEVPDRDLGQGIERARAEEAGGLLRALTGVKHVVALDAGGRERSSEELAEWLSARMVAADTPLGFAVGGSAGLDPHVLERAQEVLSLSRMTLPHQLCRVVLLEQLYRAYKILRAEPYHL